MKILVTGSKGFTGQHLCRMASEQGFNVVQSTADIRQIKQIQDELLNNLPDAIIHLAGISNSQTRNAIELQEVNALGTRNLLESMQQLGMSKNRVIIASSSLVYARSDNILISEESEISPLGSYAKSKMEMEQIADGYCSKLQIIVMRPFNYTGPGQRSDFLVPKLVGYFARKHKTIPLGNTDVEREYNNIKMVCSAYLKTLHNGVTGEKYNICSGKAYSINRLIQLLSAITGHTIEVETRKELIRNGEPPRIAGDARKLLKMTGDLEEISITDTLLQMLDYKQLISMSERH